jgi:protoheme IX farnesyltransferase
MPSSRPVPIATEPGAPAASASPRASASAGVSRLRAFFELTKPGIAFFAMTTAGAAYYVAARGSPDWTTAFHTLVGTLLATAGALALNQYQERRLDALMSRTRSRPLPSGRLNPKEALVFGSLLLAGGLAQLWAMVGAPTALLTLASAAAYNLVYTPLKLRTPAATFAGAIPGAMPALIGWSAAAQGLGAGALALFAIGFVWQLPHVMSIAWLVREDYERAGFRLLPPTDAGGLGIARRMIAYTLVLLGVSVVPTLLGFTGWVYLGGAVILGLAFLARCVAARGMSDAAVRGVFLASLAYQPLLLALMIFDTVSG